MCALPTSHSILVDVLGCEWSHPVHNIISIDIYKVLGGQSEDSFLSNDDIDLAK